MPIHSWVSGDNTITHFDFIRRTHLPSSSISRTSRGEEEEEEDKSPILTNHNFFLNVYLSGFFLFVFMIHWQNSRPKFHWSGVHLIKRQQSEAVILILLLGTLGTWLGSMADRHG